MSLDPVDVLGYETPQLAPRRLRNLSSAKQIRSLGSKLCRALGPDANVEAAYQCAHKGHWGAVKTMNRLCKPRSKRQKGSRS